MALLTRHLWFLIVVSPLYPLPVQLRGLLPRCPIVPTDKGLGLSLIRPKIANHRLIHAPPVHSYVVCYLGVLAATLPSVVGFYRSNSEFRTPLFVVQVGASLCLFI